MMNSRNLQMQLPVQDLSSVVVLLRRSFASKKRRAPQCPLAARGPHQQVAASFAANPHRQGVTSWRLVAVVRAANNDDGGGTASESSSSGGGQGDDGDDDEKEDADDGDMEQQQQQQQQNSSSSSGLSSRREDLERLVGPDDDAKFNGLDLANLIRKKYGRSYDVTLIKKEFMGRNLLAMNVMWKYREQRSFPLSEEEYLLRLDDVANTLKCWGAVAHVRNTLEKLKDRPRIGKAVSIFIDMDQTGARSDEWIYK